MTTDYRNLKELLLGLGIVLLSVVVFGVIIFFGSKQIESRNSTVSEAEQQDVAGEDIRASWDALMGRINNQDHAAVDELLSWSNAHGYGFSEYQAGENSRYIFFYRTNEFNQLPNGLVIQGGDALKAIDLGYSRLKAIGMTEHETFLFKNDVRGYTDDSSDGCKWDQSFFEVDTTGTINSPITDSACDGVRKLVFRLESGEDVAFEFVRGSDVMLSEDALVLKTASGTWFEIPRDHRGNVSEEVLTAFLKAGDRSSLFFPRYDQFLGKATTTLYFRPTPHLDEESVAINNCKSQWGFSIADFKDGSKEQLVVIEKCMEVLHYPFKKFPIPGSTSYYGFMGNGSSIGENYGWSPGGAAENSVWCQIDGLPNGCMLYKVEHGIPILLVDPDRGRDAEGPSLIQQELLRAGEDESLLVHRFPYEICMFSTYENVNYRTGISVGVVDYQEGGCAGATTSSLAFYPNNKTVELEIRGGTFINDSLYTTTTLYYNDIVLGELNDIPAQVAFTPGLGFPQEKHLRSYALQTDKTKFYFTVGDQKYMLDLAPAVPSLIRH